MSHNIFGFLKYLGTPFNLKRRPSAIQILIFFLTTALSVWTAWKHRRPGFAKDGEWYIYFIMFVMRFSEASMMILFSAKNMRPRHPLVAIVEEIVENEGKTKHTVWPYLSLGTALPHLGILIHIEWRFARRVIPSLFNILKELILFMQVAQVIVPLHALTSRLSDIRTRLHSYSHDPGLNHSKEIMELIAIERRLEEVFNQLTEEYGKDFIRILFISTGRISILLSGSVVVLLTNIYGRNMFIFSVILLELISPLCRIWSIVGAAQSVKSQMEKFRSELYTKCLEDQSGNLAKNDMMSVFLERGLSHVSFTANGFLPLDHSLFCRMLSSAVTWVFIIIQFRIRDQ
ncbi:Gustatory receptor 188d [Halyomorpha halys]|nr:Gustatory receptor 188d [Halyomorpha halys]